MLQKFSFPGYPGPVLFVVMDGVGLSPNPEGNAVLQAYTPTLDRLMRDYPHLPLIAHGTAVGLPSDQDMGNSEVGHNAIGAGQIYSQGAKLVAEAIAGGALFERGAWRELCDNCRRNGSILHLIGLFSDGNVHSHIDHLKALVSRAKTEGIHRVRIHILLDGRDVGETSALEFVDPFEEFLNGLRTEGFDPRIASGGGRMRITMDRYGANWGIVAVGWKTHVLGEGRQFNSAHEAITVYRQAEPVIDQDLPAFVIAENGQPVGTIQDGDSVIFFNFRGDRAIEISRAFEDDQFPYFDRIRRPKVLYAGMLEYDGDLHIPKRYLVEPPEIRNTMGEALARSGLTQLALSETQKFGHVTYFWNGNRSGKFDERLETYLEIPSDQVPFEERPGMKAAEITDRLCTELLTGKYRLARINFPNGDMVGHTGNFAAARIAVETVDLCLARILRVLDELRGMAIITADHGNAEEMLELDAQGRAKKDAAGNPKAKTSHTLNPVPCIFYDNIQRGAYRIIPGRYGLANLAAATVRLLGYEPLPDWEPGMLEFL